MSSPEGLYREAERQFKSSLKEQDMVMTHLELCKVYLRLDIPQTALKHLTIARYAKDNRAPFKCVGVCVCLTA